MAQTLPPAWNPDRFAGNNGEYEIETLDEFLKISQGVPPEQLNGKDYVFQEVDFSSMPAEVFRKYNFAGSNFWGCTLPEGVTAKELRDKGALVEENPPDLPYKPFRAFMYRQEELKEHDEAIYQFYKTQKGIKVAITQAVHDHSIRDALGDYLEGKTPVGIMGGHKMSRSSEAYRKVVYLARKLARLGFVVATGGGPGAMEAANLGAYMAQRSDEEVEEALQILREGNDKYPIEYMNVEAAERVLKRFGMPTYMPSLGIPTWKYGHEPSNKFATWHAKFFSNALREADLLDVCTGGIIFTAGSAGTRQEIFQSACSNHYASWEDCAPMIFLEKQHWEKCGVWDVLWKTSEGRPYHDWLLCTDSAEEAIDLIVKHAEQKKLPRFTDLESLKEPHWYYRQQRHRATAATTLLSPLF